METDHPNPNNGGLVPMKNRILISLSTIVSAMFLALPAFAESAENAKQK